MKASERAFGPPSCADALVLRRISAALSTLARASPRSRWSPFTALDMREVFHQVDENREGLALLAGVVAVLHVPAAAVRAQRRDAIPAS